jgi:D-alanine-D-alanine ligase
MAQGKRKNVLVLFGGRSPEHEISLLSAASVLKELDRQRYTVLACGIDRQGYFRLHQEVDFSAAALKRTGAGEAGKLLSLSPGAGCEAFRLVGQDEPFFIDVVFPVLHGSFGEDGTVQGLLEMLPIPYVGCDVVGSGASIDKELTKALARQAGVPVVPSNTVRSDEWQARQSETLARASRGLSFPLFVKPARLGSSVGIAKVKNESDLSSSLDEAFKFDVKVLVEQGIEAREIEVSVLGNEELRASVPGEVIPSREFYDYAAKYLDGTSKILIPAPLPPELSEIIREYAIAGFRAVGGEGMARVDFLLDKKTQQPYLNEINGIPGFTSISMYPKMWAASGLAYRDLLSELVELALRRFARGQKLHLQYLGQTPS